MATSEERLEDVFQDEIIGAFSDLSRFKMFARSRHGLCLNESDIQNIVEDEHNSFDKKMAMLSLWKQINENDATVQKIRDIVKNYKRKQSYNRTDTPTETTPTKQISNEARVEKTKTNEEQLEKVDNYQPSGGKEPSQISSPGYQVSTGSGIVQNPGSSSEHRISPDISRTPRSTGSGVVQNPGSSSDILSTLSFQPSGENEHLPISSAGYQGLFQVDGLQNLDNSHVSSSMTRNLPETFRNQTGSPSRKQYNIPTPSSGSQGGVVIQRTNIPYFPEKRMKEGSKVFEAERKGVTDEKIVVKFITNPNEKDEREVKHLINAGDSEYVVKYLDFGFCKYNHEDAIFILMERLEEKTLADKIKEDNLSYEVREEFVRCIAKGLQHLNDKGIVHRDLKPHNILFRNGKPVISDFGLFVKAGTNGWRAPETGSSGKETSPSADVFSSGLLYHFILTNGSHPYPGKEEIHWQTFIDTDEDETKCNLQELYKTPDGEIAMRSMLRRDPNRRPPIKEVLKHLFFFKLEDKSQFFEFAKGLLQSDKTNADALNSFDGEYGQKVREEMEDWKERLLLTDQEKKTIVENFLKEDVSVEVDVNVMKKKADEFKDCVTEVDPLDKPTRICQSTATLIDHLYYNRPEFEINTNLITYDLSDHLPILASIEFSCKKESLRIKKRDFSNFIVENYNEHLENKIKSEIDKVASVNDKFNKFINTLQAIINIHVPYKYISRKESKISMKPWITKGLMVSIKNKNKMYDKCYKKKDLLKFEIYKTYRCKLNSLLKTAKLNYYKKMLEHYKKNISKTWEQINKIINKNKKRGGLPSSILIDEKKISCSQDICNALNKHFVNVGPNLASKINIINDNKFSILGKSSSMSFYLNDVTSFEIEMLINKLDVKKAIGPDCIPTKLIKLSRSVLAPILSELINLSFRHGTYPNILKVTKVIPIFKKGNKQDPNNYRPISLLSQIAKLFEKTIYDRLVNFFNKTNRLCDSQFGFRNSYSTTLAVTKLKEHIINNINKKHMTCAIFLDLAKAFDTVNHDILLKKLFFYGVRGTPHKLLTSYLHQRRQYMENNEQYRSQLEYITCGIPQGSTLGPFLFIVYINDLPYASSFYSTLFADDTSLVKSAHTLQQLQIVVNTEICKIDKWLKINKLSLNYSKTTFMVLGPRQKRKEFEFKLKIGETLIEQTKTIKYLGIIIDEDLTWKPQIDELCRNVAKNIGIFYKLRNYVDEKIMKILYYSLVFSKLQYGILSWGSANKTNLKPLCILQNKFLRCITQTEHLRIKNSVVYKQCGILNLNDIYMLEVGKFMYQYENNLLPEIFNDYFTEISNIHSYNTRGLNRQVYFTPRFNTNIGKNSIKYEGIRVWGLIPSEIKECSFAAFKQKYKQYLASLYPQ